jgi:restriction endonuclease S subunit
MRLDGNYHLSDGLTVRKLIFDSPYNVVTVSDVTSDIYCPGIFKRNYVKSGVSFLGGNDIQKQSLDTGKYLREKNTPNYKILQIKEGWTLVTCGGTIGDVAFANKLLAKCWLSQHVMRVVPNKIKEGMLYAYLASKYGKLLLTTDTYGSVIPTLNADCIGKLPIPVFPNAFQQTIDELIQSSARFREEATGLLNSAETILANYIDVQFSKHEFLTGNISSRAIYSSLQHRMDPPALINDGVKSMKQVIDKFQTNVIGDMNNVKVYRPGIFKRCYVKEGLPYIKGSEIFLCNPFRRCDHLSRTRTPFIDEMKMKEGQILITCAGSVGDIKLITKEYMDKGAIGSQDIIRLESSNLLYTKEYLFTYLQLPFVYDYIQSMKYGSVIERIEPFHVESIPVVTPTSELSEQITAIIRRYMDCTYRAFITEERAISMVEQEIEKWSD